jgi:hypothetical protein
MQVKRAFNEDSTDSEMRGQLARGGIHTFESGHQTTLDCKTLQLSKLNFTVSLHVRAPALCVFGALFHVIIRFFPFKSCFLVS